MLGSIGPVTYGMPEDFARSFIADPQILDWVDRCWICPAHGSPASDLQVNWKRLDPDSFLRAVAWSKANLGIDPPDECWPQRCQSLVDALDTEPAQP